MAITSLSGTKWQINSLTCSAGYDNFEVGDLKHNDTTYESSYLYIGYEWSEDGLVATANTIIIMQALATLSVGDTIEFLDESETYSDLTNATLISWLESNATLLYQPTEPVLQLAPFLTNIANAIRTKKGTTEPINAQNFASEIESIESGGGLVGYSGTITIGYGILNDSFVGLADDGTISTDRSDIGNKKWVFIICYATGSGGGYISSSNNIISGTVPYRDYVFYIKPTADNWSVSFDTMGT